MLRSSIRQLLALCAVLGAARGVAAEALAGSLIVNGSFEEGPPIGAFVNLPGGSTAIPGWTVTGEGIDFVGVYWKSADGIYAIDLDGSAGSRTTPPYVHGGIVQPFATTPGTRYRVRFAMAGNPNRPPPIKPLRIAAAGQEAEFTFDCTGKTGQSMGWRREEWVFTAREATTTLVFSSLTVSPLTGYGPAIDDVVVEVLAAPLDVTETSGEIHIALDASLLFDSGAHALKPEAAAALAALVEVLETHPGRPVLVEGHTDSVGSDETNKALSERRARAVRDWLVAHGAIPEAAITARGLGESAPVASNESADGRQRNRRVEVKLQKPAA